MFWFYLENDLSSIWRTIMESVIFQRETSYWKIIILRNYDNYPQTKTEAFCSNIDLNESKINLYTRHIRRYSIIILPILNQYIYIKRTCYLQQHQQIFNHDQPEYNHFENWNGEKFQTSTTTISCTNINSIKFVFHFSSFQYYSIIFIH